MSIDFLDLKKQLPILGIGLGLRREIAAETFANIKEIDWLEFTPENYMRMGGTQRDILEIAASRFPLTSHGVKLSIGSSDELDFRYLEDLKHLLKDFSVPWFSDHFCYSSAAGFYLHDLLPLPRTKELVAQMAKRIQQVQDFIGLPLLLENISYYMEMPGSTYSESEFISEVLEKADCGLLLDLNNVVVNSLNHRFDPFEFLSKLPLDRTVQIHMAGHTVQPTRVVDTHGDSITETTFRLLEKVVNATTVNAIMIERDQNFPDFSSLLEELQKLRDICSRSTHTSFAKVHETPQEVTPLIVSTGSKSAFNLAEQVSIQTEGSFPEATRAGKLKKKRKSKVLSGNNRNLNFDMIERALTKFWLAKQELPAVLLEGAAQEGFDLYDSILTYGREHHLACMYPLCEEILGEQWSEVSAEFGRIHPSTHYSLREFAAPFSEYLAGRQDLQSKYPFISELAQMEKSRLEILESELVVESAAFAEWNVADDLRDNRPIVNAVLQIHKFRFPIHRLTSHSGDEICMSPAPSILAIYRDPATKGSLLASLTEQTCKLIELAALNQFSYLDLIEQLAPPEDHQDAVEARMKLLDSFVTLQKLRIFVGSASLLQKPV